MFYPSQLWLQPVSNAVIIPGAPGSPKGNNQFVFIYVWKLEGNVGVFKAVLRHYKLSLYLKPMLGQSLTNRSNRADVIVLNE
jgi:hypothetical protein